MDSQLREVDLLVLLLYMAGVFGLGCWFARRSQKTDAFMTAGGSLPGWAVGLSIFGTYVSSIGFLGNTGKAYSTNWNAWVFGLSLPIAAWIATRYFVPLYRRGNEVSAYAQLEHRFGPWARTYALVCYLLAQLGRMGTILYLVALALAPLTGWDVRTIILVTGVLVTVYTLLGGIEAVIWTDVVQSIVLAVGAVLCAVILVTRMPGGMGTISEVADKHDKFSLGSFDLSLTESTFWVVLIYGIFINLTNFGIDQSFVQRYLTARSDADAKRSVWLGALLFLPASTLFFFIGTALFAFYQQQPDLLPAGIEGDKVLPHFMVHELPTGLTGLLIAAIFAAAMSSMDTSLNSSASLFLCDVYKRYWRPEAGERESMRVLHGTTLIWGLVGTIMAVVMIGQKSALDAWWKYQGVFSGGMLGLFLLGLISRRTGNLAAIHATVVGLTIIAYLTLDKTQPLHSFCTIVLGTTSVVLSGMALTLLLGKRWYAKP